MPMAENTDIKNLNEMAQDVMNQQFNNKEIFKLADNIRIKSGIKQ